MERRDFIARSAVALIAASVGASPSLFASSTTHSSPASTHPSADKPTLAFVIYPGMTPLDIIGPATALAGGVFNVEFVWRDLQPVKGELAHVQFVPTTTFKQLKKVDILCVTGTGNPYALLNETEMLDWLHEVGSRAQWVTSVCTGSILLGAAGLMKGYKATTHWSMIDDLARFGALPQNDRVVIDRNRISGGGVTAGIDFGLTLRARLLGDESAKAAQLLMQYDPQPPFHSGTPQQAGEAMTTTLRKSVFSMVEAHTPDWQQRLQQSVERMSRYQ